MDEPLRPAELDVQDWSAIRGSPADVTDTNLLGHGSPPRSWRMLAASRGRPQPHASGVVFATIPAGAWRAGSDADRHLPASRSTASQAAAHTIHSLPLAIRPGRVSRVLSRTIAGLEPPTTGLVQPAIEEEVEGDRGPGRREAADGGGRRGRAQPAARGVRRRAEPTIADSRSRSTARGVRPKRPGDGRRFRRAAEPPRRRLIETIERRILAGS
jgi:hypothetical protein